MNNTPSSNRKQIAVFGKTNAGKSSFINSLIGQEVSLVSDVKGTTTDPVIKAVELIPFGPVLFIDTAGLDDNSELGRLRIKKTYGILDRTDFAIYVLDATDEHDDNLKKFINIFERRNIPYMIVVNKIDLLSEDELLNKKKKYSYAEFVSSLNRSNLETFREKLISKLGDNTEPPIIGDLLPYNSIVVLVVPVDSEAPKGRLILPQVQVIRDCLDHGQKAYVVRDLELLSAISDLRHIDLVVTDSQAFKTVENTIPKDLKLTSFSILYARHKGELDIFVESLNCIKNLVDGSKILIAESCSHNHSHEDIGRVKIPKLLKEHTKAELHFDFAMGCDFPEDLSNYDLVIHCGGCMHNRRSMMSRINRCQEQNVPITNYGVLLAYLNGILERSLEIFKRN